MRVWLKAGSDPRVGALFSAIEDIVYDGEKFICVTFMPGSMRNGWVNGKSLRLTLEDQVIIDQAISGL